MGGRLGRAALFTSTEIARLTTSILEAAESNDHRKIAISWRDMRSGSGSDASKLVTPTPEKKYKAAALPRARPTAHATVLAAPAATETIARG